MLIGVPKEIKIKEGRVGLSPLAVDALIEKGHKVFVEANAGVLSGFSDEDYQKAGALIVSKEIAWGADVIVKVKEPLPSEYDFLRRGQVVYTFFHFPDNLELKEVVRVNGVLAMPYENIVSLNGNSKPYRPILAPMSRIAAEVAIDVGAHYLRSPNGGSGILLQDAISVVIGHRGIAGDRAFQRLHLRTHNYGGQVIGFDKDDKTVMGLDLVGWLKHADLVICCAADKNTVAPKIITREMVKTMQKGSVIVDIAIDEGGCCETSHKTTHDDPVFIEEGVIHYCVANMPGAVPRSSTPALVQASLPFLLEIVAKGWERALEENPALKNAAQF